jgi:hypothetical protein
MNLPIFAIRRRRFDEAAAKLPERRWTCPRCAFPTLRERGVSETCRLCCWEDDGRDDAQLVETREGVTLARARAEAEGALAPAAVQAYLAWLSDPTPAAWNRALKALPKRR